MSILEFIREIGKGLLFSGLQIPKNFRVQPGSVRHNSFTVMWDGVSGADAYRLAVQPGFGMRGLVLRIY